MSGISFKVPEESSSSISHTYKAHLKHDGNKSHLHDDFHTDVKNITHAQYRKRKYTIGTEADMVKEDFEEILRFFEKRSTQEIYEDCVHMLHDNEDLDANLPECRTNYHYTTLERDFLIRFWLYHMGVEDHVANAILVKDNTSCGGVSEVGDRCEVPPRLNSLQNLTTLDAEGMVGLSRVERFHRLLDKGAVGNCVGRHYVPNTKHGSVYWSENFTLQYGTVFTEPLRSVTTSALSRLLTERSHLLRLPRQPGHSGERNNGCAGGEGQEVLARVVDQVSLSPPAPESSVMTAVNDISPHYHHAVTVPLPGPDGGNVDDRDGEKEQMGGGSSVTRTELDSKTHSEQTRVLSPSQMVETTCGRDSDGDGDGDGCSSSSSVSDSDSDSDTTSSNHSGSSSEGEERETGNDVSKVSSEDTRRDAGEPSSSSCSIGNGCSDSASSSISATCGSKRQRSMVDGDCDDDAQSDALYTSAKVQALEQCMGRRFEGVADSILEMVFKFSEPYVDMMTGDDDEDADERHEEKDTEEEDELEEGMGSKEKKGLGRSYEEFYFRAFDPKQKGLLAKDGQGGKQSWKRKRERAAGVEAGESLNWEHVLECAQTAAAETNTATNSTSVEVHHLLPRLQLTPALLRRVRSRATALFNSSTKHHHCAPRGVRRNDRREGDSAQNNSTNSGGSRSNSDCQLLPQLPSSASR